MKYRSFALGALLLNVAAPLSAQQPPDDLVRERAAYDEWLKSAPNSPLAAVAQQAIGNGVTLGPPDADVPLPGIGEHRVIERAGAVTLEGASGRKTLAPGRPLPLGDYAVAAGGVAGRRVVTVYGQARGKQEAEYYGYDPGLVFVGPLLPPEDPARQRVLAVDGIEVEALEAGTVRVPLNGRAVTLKVRRIPTGAEDESELEIFFRDGTSGSGTYPAGRFVSLIPEAGGRYRLDFNRARNPFCAYSSAFPCPAPWRGNTVAARVEAGERYLGGGLEAPPAGLEER